jgi:hypothetical protein
MRGITISEVNAAGYLVTGRVYMEFVDTDTTPIDEYLQRLARTSA